MTGIELPVFRIECSLDLELVVNAPDQMIAVEEALRLIREHMDTLLINVGGFQIREVRTEQAEGSA